MLTIDRDELVHETGGRLSAKSRKMADGGGVAQDDVTACYPWLMQPAKTTVRALLEKLPDDCSLEDVVYHLYVIQKIEAGLADAEAGKLIPHEQVAEELRRKWVTGAA
jgi:hypothetical protein